MLGTGIYFAGSTWDTRHIRFWLAKGMDEFRIDTVNEYSKHVEPSNMICQYYAGNGRCAGLSEKQTEIQQMQYTAEEEKDVMEDTETAPDPTQEDMVREQVTRLGTITLGIDQVHNVNWVTQCQSHSTKRFWPPAFQTRQHQDIRRLRRRHLDQDLLCILPRNATDSHDDGPCSLRPLRTRHFRLWRFLIEMTDEHELSKDSCYLAPAAPPKMWHVQLYHHIPLPHSVAQAMSFLWVSITVVGQIEQIVRQQYLDQSNNTANPYIKADVGDTPVEASNSAVQGPCTRSISILCSSSFWSSCSFDQSAEEPFTPRKKEPFIWRDRIVQEPRISWEGLAKVGSLSSVPSSKGIKG
ncbi:hypothetical protein P171DRAFT_520809 [Karstenula rhodostoma CBS 690.94]|uniref:Uncharacterized protein n=1 Tax=Karstenula rhodostoma CBS 690.94 TaxID=1392251 RepID=A0A9P4PJZ3_9PLEO|nr:hypothetical protein P171DRAFT_520809 [Karstenula rhodostoma CBS 690.94]